MTGAAHRALILLGSNIERERNMPAALTALAAHPEWALRAVSSIYESAAVGGKGPQPVFANAAVLLETGREVSALRAALRQLEAAQGRVRTGDKYAPRPIDMDIVLFDDFVGAVEGSEIPDPDLLRFPHVIVPCAEIAPDWPHPVSGSVLAEIAQRIGNTDLQLSYRPDIRNQNDRVVYLNE